MIPQIDRIDRYEVIRPLGEGGMGVLYLARDPRFDRFVAIKMIHEAFDSKKVRRRFSQEARAAGRLRHENIVTIFDVHEHNGRPCIVMEYIPGRTLDQAISQFEPISIQRKREIVTGFCAGLACAHRAGIIHRDVKPANIMIDDAGGVKVLDFGIAKISAANLTTQNTVVGTLRYMSPEQLGGRLDVDHRTDIFSATLVTYELLTYRPAFSGSVQDITRMILGGDLSSIRWDMLSPGAARVIRKGLAFDPTARYDSVSEMARELCGAQLNAMPVTVSESAEGVETESRAIYSGSTLPRDRAIRTGPLISQGVGDFTTPVEGGDLEQPASRLRPVYVAYGSAVAAVVIVLWFLISVPSIGPTPTRNQHSETAIGSPSIVASHSPQAGASRMSMGKKTPPVERVVKRVRDAAPRTDASIDKPTSPGALSASDQVAVPQLTTPVQPISALDALPVSTAPSGSMTSTSTSHTADEEEITEVIHKLERAFGNLSSAGLKAVEPSLTDDQLAAWDRTFVDSRSYSVRIENSTIKFISDGRARVDGLVNRTIVSKEGESRRISGTLTVVLSRPNGLWQIDRVVGQGWP